MRIVGRVLAFLKRLTVIAGLPAREISQLPLALDASFMRAQHKIDLAQRQRPDRFIPLACDDPIGQQSVPI